MMTLLIYDNVGRIVTGPLAGNVTEPVGIPFMWVDIPDGRYPIKVDVSKSPHTLVLSDSPRDLVAEKLAELEAANVAQRNMNITMLKAMAEVYEAFLVYMNQ